MGKALEKGPAVWCWYKRGSGRVGRWSIQQKRERGLKVGIRIFEKVIKNHSFIYLKLH